MNASLRSAGKTIFTIRWKPSVDLLAVAVSWLLVVGALYTATVIIGAEAGGGIPYFLLYAILGAAIFGIGIPVFWMRVVRKRPLSDLGITSRLLGLSLTLQLIFAGVQWFGGLAGTALPGRDNLIPLLALALAIGFFEAVFWRGWVLLRLEEAFGLIPAILLGSALYAAYHIGYGMGVDEMVFLFFIGILFAVTFRLTGSIFVLWPVFQPMGQLITLIKDGLELPLLASLGFSEALIAMLALVWLAGKLERRRGNVGIRGNFLGG
jgi:membrane protease YdiL (CAAX protease family)